MALQFEIKETERTAGGMGSFGPRSIQNGQIVTWEVRAWDDAVPLDPADITEQQVLQATTDAIPNDSNGWSVWGIPRVNEDALTIRNGGTLQVCPWLYCSAKRIVRHERNRLMFQITAEYTTGSRRSLAEDELYLIPCPDGADDEAAADALPYLRENIYSIEERVKWEETPESVSDPQVELRLPTGSQFDEPFMQKVAKRSIRQTQFEVVADEDTLKNNILDRLCSVNKDNWPDDGNALPENAPPRWMITGIDYQKMRILKADATYLEGYMMTYTLDYKLEVPGGDGVASIDGGWWDTRALIDYYELTTANDLNTKVAVFDPNGGNAIIQINLNEDGTRRDPAQGLVYKNFKIQPSLAFTRDLPAYTGFLYP